jgi:hypothetical protein
MAKPNRIHFRRPRAVRKVKYRVPNWRRYEQALSQRGAVTLWVDQRWLSRWYRRERAGKRGAPFIYSAGLIVCMLMLKAVYHLSNRETEGLLRSLLRLMRARYPVPDHTTLSRRGRRLYVPLRRQPQHRPLDLLLDSTGLQLVGVSPWRAWQGARWRQAQTGNQDFRKIHLALNAETQSIEAVEVTDKHVHDNRLVEPLLARVKGTIRQVTADGNYDFEAARLPIRARGALDLIPPRADAVIIPAWPRPGRDQALKLIARLGGRAAWKRQTGYHQRSLIETAFSRMKGRLGQRLRSREKSRQITEVRVWCQVLNRMAQLGLPHSQPVPAI